MTLKEKLAKRATLVVNMRAILDKAEKANVELTAEQTTAYEQMETEVADLTKGIQRANALAEVENNLRAQRDSSYRPNAPPRQGEQMDNGLVSAVKNALFIAKPRPGIDGEEGYTNALDTYWRRGKSALEAEHLNALQVGNDSEGGFLVPIEFERALIEILVNLDPIRRLSTVITTASDKIIPIETGKGTFAYIGEEGVYPKSDPSLGRVALSAFKSGGIIQVSEELLQDEFFGLPAYLQRLAGWRYNALESNSFAVGNGVNKPLGLFSTTAVGTRAVGSVTGATSASAVITFDDFINVFHSLPRPYRQRATWLTSDTLVKMTRKLKDTTNQYLWQPAVIAGQPDAILGRPVEVSDDAPAPAAGGAGTAGSTSIAFGDFSHYYIGDRLGTQVQRLNELYAESGQVGFRFTRRNDARLTSADAFTFFKQGPSS